MSVGGEVHWGWPRTVRDWARGRSRTSSGDIVQYNEVSPNTRRGACGLLLPPKMAIDNPHENVLLPRPVAELMELELMRPAEAVFDQGVPRKATGTAMEPVGSALFIAGSRSNGARGETRKRLGSHRVDCEGCIAHVKREYGAARSRLKGDQGAKTWAAWSARTGDDSQNGPMLAINRKLGYVPVYRDREWLKTVG